jgi:hypothetical protein
MAGAYAYTPAIWPPLAAAASLAALGLYSWRRRDVPGARWLAAGSLISVLSLLAVALEAAAVNPSTKSPGTSSRPPVRCLRSPP